MASNNSCTSCPIYSLSTNEFEELSSSEIISVSPSPHCHRVYKCLSNLVTNPSFKTANIDYPPANVTLFQNGKNQPFASCLVIWQACNLMTHRPFHNWQQEGDYIYCHYAGRSGKLIYRLPKGTNPLEDIDIRSVLIHLLLAACATQKKRPWAEEIVINDRVITEFLGLHQRRDMNRLKKLLLIQSLIEQVRELEVEIYWEQRGKIKAIHIPNEPIWSIDTTYHISATDEGLRYLVGLSFKVLAGKWAAYFLNQEEARNRTAYYQYSWLPISLPPKIMNLWQRHEGAVVMLLYLLFKWRVGSDRSAKVATLLKQVYGEDYLQTAWYKADVRRKIISTFEADMEQLFYYGLKPVFDNDSYPEEIQPDWLTVQQIPDDPEEALQYWIEDANENKISTNSKKKWMGLLNATISDFELPDDWRTEVPKAKAKPKPRTTSLSSPSEAVTGDMIKQARMQQGISQRQLSALLNKSQSWIRDIESGRYKIKQKDVALLSSILGNIKTS
ncbi:MAG: helix-turn-helix transcriptional regulator [Pseudanabaenaceae cyanobacterium SKYGB_i_bin29]|nr:helix-turn-helix transcriptional regulator [Pseudanabaenaceae cyanobacterium SKYG29]MDW8422221.1 helix-turn-helix transcriptional regulator [Pseudanabaenaceae cyanobacterium SKYGB_i_bin29]